MLKLEQSKSKIVLKGNNYFFVMGIVAIIMAAIGCGLILSLLPFEEGYTFSDVFGLIYLCLWVILVLSGAIFSFVTGSKKIIINDDGILCSTFLKKNLLKWAEIKDWGLSYCGQTKGEGNTYYFYFSHEPQRNKNECKKRLKGKMIKTYIIGDDYSEVLSKVIPFCKERTSVEPFIAKDKFHLI